MGNETNIEVLRSMLCAARDGSLKAPTDNRTATAALEAAILSLSADGGEAVPFAWVEPGTFNCVSNETRKEFPEDARTFDIPVYTRPPPAPLSVTDAVVDAGAKGAWELVPRGVPWEQATHCRDEWLRISRAVLEAALASLPGVVGDAVLPCDVIVAPATRIRKGCKVRTLLDCIASREGADPFPDADTEAFGKLLREIRETTAPPAEATAAPAGDVLTDRQRKAIESAMSEAEHAAWGMDDDDEDAALARDLHEALQKLTQRTTVPLEWTAYVSDWFAACRRALEDVATEMRATGRGDDRFVGLLETMPRATPPAGGAATGEGLEAVAEVVDYGDGTKLLPGLAWHGEHGAADFPIGTKLYTAPSAGAVVGELIEIGDDEEGQPRLLIHSTREAIRAANLIPFRNVRVTLAPADAAAAQQGVKP